MILDIRIYLVIALFAVVCLSLIAYNLLALYQYRANVIHRVKNWKARKLRKTKKLMAYAHALKSTADTPIYGGYIISGLAKHYSKKHSACRAVYANFVANFPHLVDTDREDVIEILISYIDNNIYCRNNVLRALCGLGTAQGVVKALHTINNTYFLHHQLLTDALCTFTGNREALAELLWEESDNWNSMLQTGVVDFITQTTHRFGADFMPLLSNPSTNENVRAAAVRYYGTYVYAPARPMLIELLQNPTYINVAAQAAQALDKYPAQDTYEALLTAQHSPFWPIRNVVSKILQIKSKIAA